MGKDRRQPALVAGVEQAAEDTDPERATDLQGGAVGGRAHAGLVDGEGSHHGLGAGREGKARAEAHQQERGKHVHIRVVDRDPGQEPEAQGDDGHSCEDDRLCPEYVVQHARQGSNYQQYGRDRCDPQAGLKGRVSKGEL